MQESSKGFNNYGTGSKSSTGACAETRLCLQTKQLRRPLPLKTQRSACTARKKHHKHPANWRSAEFQEYILSIDRTITRRTERGKVMILYTTDIILPAQLLLTAQNGQKLLLTSILMHVYTSFVSIYFSSQIYVANAMVHQ